MENNDKQPLNKGKMDNPDQMNTERESIYDKFEEEQTVDSIPLEDLRIEQQDEKKKHHTKDSSSSEKKFPG
ncbi:hypothetical protein [Domibacillus epiphyticus]|uniref:Uncharacterized protein n=1 Tax=Domibacillus epiphyticus TaxID=1714355 RepID=A0A1V2AAP2_9BACI|nr:hypothetical protein [Domibacillus epiphyticus]OMP68065.1 hypothetical protein BTO28_03695 [Domibacillus epiphyticus]